MTAVGTLWAGNLQRALEEIGTEIKPAVIAEQVQWMLGDEEAGLNRPLYWRSWEELEGSGGVQKSGRLRSEVILFTFYWHLQSITGLSLFDNDDDAPPIGAYTLAIQAVERAYKAHVTGKKVLPTGQTAWFSVDNWGDTFKYAAGRKIKNARASKFSNTIAAFTLRDWETILNDTNVLRTGLKMEGRKKVAGSASGSAYESDEGDSGPEYEVMLSD
ncbi:hypothetical protein PHLCEN_2v12033 [Hermanssonia centrifuga]|uniref:Uncharacterized protein n=1 Tax=Hermanssonia centrifuga TaxID=98765 RepID=A0A2R6NIG5_9APHY|nr:hypothetical protein PHLCEN_2v12033 [Hermanssonia centrifuga]